MNHFNKGKFKGSYVWSHAFKEPTLFVNLLDKKRGVMRRANVDEVIKLIEDEIIPSTDDVKRYYKHIKFKKYLLQILSPSVVIKKLKDPTKFKLKEIKRVEHMAKGFEVIEYVFELVGIKNPLKGKEITSDRIMLKPFLDQVEKMSKEKNIKFYSSSQFINMRRDPLGREVGILVVDLITMSDLTGYRIYDIYKLLTNG